MLLLSTTVNYIRTKFADLRAHEDGVTAVEYALMVAIIALLMVAGFFLLFDNVRTAFNNTGDCVADADGVRRRAAAPGSTVAARFVMPAGQADEPPAGMASKHVPRSTDL